MKVLLVSFEFGQHVLGGLGRVINGLTGELRQHAQLDVYLLYLNPRRLAISARVLRCDQQRWGVEIDACTRGYARHCVELIRRERYDIVHFSSVHWIIENVLDAITRELPDQKLVYSVHSLIEYERGIRQNPASFLRCERKLLAAASIIHVLNETSRAYLARAYPDLEAKPLCTIPNGISPGELGSRDEAFEAGLARRLQPGVFTIVCLSRWAHGKGLEHLVEAAQRLLESGVELQLVLAGRKLISWEKRFYTYVARVQRRAARLGSRCVILGWLNGPQRNSLFASADVCVVPSELEYYPYSVLEPAAAGLPLVCSDLPCVRELLRGGRECSLFRTGDAEDLAHALRQVRSAPELARRMADQARATVTRVCDWTPIARAYGDMYGTVLSQRASPRPSGVRSSTELGAA